MWKYPVKVWESGDEINDISGNLMEKLGDKGGNVVCVYLQRQALNITYLHPLMKSVG